MPDFRERKQIFHTKPTRQTALTLFAASTATVPEVTAKTIQTLSI
jgi:hypothetical protein